MSTISTGRFGLAAIAAVMALALGACGAGESTGGNASAGGSTEADTTHTVTDMAGNKVEIPESPENVVVTDNHAFQILDDWGVELAAAPKGIISGDVVSYAADDDVVNLGNHREPDLEALVGVKPDLVISGYRFADHAEEIREIIPEDAAFVDLSIPEDMPLDQYLRDSTELLGEIFGKQDQAQQRVDDFNDSIERAQKAYNPEHTAMGIITTGGDINYAAPGVGRAVGPVFDWLNLTPALNAEGSSDHKGSDVSVEAIAESNPYWMLILDRDQAIASDEEGYQPAAELLKNSDALQKVTAIQQDHLVYFPEDFYLHEDIILYTEFLNDLADHFEQAGS